MAAEALDGLPAELEEFARARNAVRALKLELPLLTALVPAREGMARIEGIQDLIRATVVVSADPLVRRAAAELFYPHDGWERAYSARRLDAARAYGLDTVADWDRGDEAGLSPHEEFLHEVARLIGSLVAVRPTVTIVDAATGDLAVVHRLPPARVRTVPNRLAIAAAIAAAVAGGIVAAAQSSPAAPATALHATEPIVTVVTTDDPTATTVKQASLAPIPGATPATTDGAATTTAESTAPPPPVLLSPDGTSVPLSAGAWQSYLAIGGGNADAAQQLAGSPSTVTTTDAATTVALSNGGALVGAPGAGPYFWIPSTGNAYNAWLFTGGVAGSLGRPTSNPFTIGADNHETWYQPGMYLEFEHGSMYSPTSFAVADPQIVPATDQLGPLAGLGDVHSHILRQAGGQSWMIDQNDVAHWVPDATVAACLNSARTTVAHVIPGYTIAAFTRGDNATCDIVAD